MLLAVPCARDPVEVMTQGHNLRTGFINYLQQKHAAGIVNIQEPGSNQVTTTEMSVNGRIINTCTKTNLEQKMEWNNF